MDANLQALAAKAMGILNALHRFGVPAMASAFFNVGSIVGGLLLGFVVGPRIGLGAIEGMALGKCVIAYNANGRLPRPNTRWSDGPSNCSAPR